jgi:hypothetical protein
VVSDANVRNRSAGNVLPTAFTAHNHSAKVRHNMLLRRHAVAQEKSIDVLTYELSVNSIRGLSLLKTWSGPNFLRRSRRPCIALGRSERFRWTASAEASRVFEN